MEQLRPTAATFEGAVESKGEQFMFEAVFVHINAPTRAR